jgi:hypothetical protein
MTAMLQHLFRDGRRKVQTEYLANCHFQLSYIEAAQCAEPPYKFGGLNCRHLLDVENSLAQGWVCD